MVGRATPAVVEEALRGCEESDWGWMVLLLPTVKLVMMVVV